MYEHECYTKYTHTSLRKKGLHRPGPVFETRGVYGPPMLSWPQRPQVRSGANAEESWCEFSQMRSFKDPPGSVVKKRACDTKEILPMPLTVYHLKRDSLITKRDLGFPQPCLDHNAMSAKPRSFIYRWSGDWDQSTGVQPCWMFKNKCCHESDVSNQNQPEF